MKSAIHSGKLKGAIRKHLSANGFTLLELLVVVGTLAVLALLMLPALAGTKPTPAGYNAQGTRSSFWLVSTICAGSQ